MTNRPTLRFRPTSKESTPPAFPNGGAYLFDDKFPVPRGAMDRFQRHRSKEPVQRCLRLATKTRHLTSDLYGDQLTSAVLGSREFRGAGSRDCFGSKPAGHVVSPSYSTSVRSAPSNLAFVRLAPWSFAPASCVGIT